MEEILKKFKQGKISLNEVLKKIKKLPFENLDFAKIDTHRSLRCGFSEVIFCQGKQKEDIVKIMQQLAKTNNNILATRVDKDIYKYVLKKIPKIEYNEKAKIIILKQKEVKLNKGLILVVSAGTADIPVAEEASVVAETMGNKVKRLYDVGVAGIHRLFHYQDLIFEANVIVVVAGMEGALPSVIAGLVDKPVIAIPTSIGYGVSLKGITPLFTMLSSCTPGIGVVNIDNGFGGGFLAASINKLGG